MSDVKGSGQFRTSDLYYAAYLKVAGVPFLGTKKELQRVFFLFEEVDGLENLKFQYFNREAKVVAMTFAEEVKVMKTLTHS